MHGEAKRLLKFHDGSDNRYIIPVYQQNYDWKPKQFTQKEFYAYNWLQ